MLKTGITRLTHSERRPQIFIPKRKSTSIVSSNGKHKFLYFHYKSVKPDVLCRQNRILWTFGNPFQSKKLPMCTLTVTLHIAHLTDKWGLIFCSIYFSLSFGTNFRIFRKPYQELLYQTTFWCGLVLSGLKQSKPFEGNEQKFAFIRRVLVPTPFCQVHD